jgi:hypothetical protein
MERSKRRKYFVAGVLAIAFVALLWAGFLALIPLAMLANWRDKRKQKRVAFRNRREIIRKARPASLRNSAIMNAIQKWAAAFGATLVVVLVLVNQRAKQDVTLLLAMVIVVRVLA